MARRRTGFQKKIEVVHWTLIQEGFSGLASGASLARNALAAQHLPETLMRIRGEWACVFDGALASGIGNAVTVGLIQVPEGTGTTVLWSPVIDGDAPWIWWDCLHLIYVEHVTDVNYTSMLSSGRRVIDSKAMRKIRNTELQWVVESPPITGFSGSTIGASMTARVLSGS